MSTSVKRNKDITIAELEQRALSVVLRVCNDPRLCCPVVGIPMGPGMKPIAMRRDLIEGQCKGLGKVRVRLEFESERAVLEITGNYGGGNGRRESWHKARLVDLNRDTGATRYQVAMWSSKQAESIQANARKLQTKSDIKELQSAMSAEELASSKRIVRLTVKLKRIDNEIGKLNKQIGKIRLSVPVNPIIGRVESWDRETSDWERERAATYYEQKSKRKLISKLAVKYLAAKTIRPNNRRNRTWRSAAIVSFPWTKFYAELLEHGIHCSYPYSKVHNRKDGPASPEEYLRNMEQFRLMKSKRDTWIYVRTQVQIAESIQRHKDARSKYVNEINERNTLLSMIEGLQAERDGIVEEIEKHSTEIREGE